MFTGIIEEIGFVRHVISGSDSGEIQIGARKVLEGTKIGDSIAVNGVCLTVTRLLRDGFTADVMPETLRRTNLGRLGVGDPVNLERAMAADGRFGGHIVSGHIDGTGTIAQRKPEGNAILVTIQAPSHIMDLIVEKGSIAIDGISLTVASLEYDRFQVSIIPHTGEETILLKKNVGRAVNLENDIVGKYVQKLLEQRSPADTGNRLTGSATSGASVASGDSAASSRSGSSDSRITWEFLAENGF
ncbi:MAG: riboflavin synthase [Firmicutes bacterium]|nr:riboflavin synthase [Bacillota bacterium]